MNGIKDVIGEDVIVWYSQNLDKPRFCKGLLEHVDMWFLQVFDEIRHKTIFIHMNAVLSVEFEDNRLTIGDSLI